MTAETTRLRFDAEHNTLTASCLTCGNTSPALGRGDHLEWLPLSVVLDLAEHTCRPGPWPQAPATPRPTDTEMIDFVTSYLTADPHGVILFEDLLDAFEAATGSSPGSGLFSRRLRAALPPGTAVRREMINGVRARRLIGMRLR